MINVSAEIVLIDGEGQTLTSAICNVVGNNVSADISKVVASQKRSIAPFIIGATKIGEDRTLESSLDYYVGSLTSDNAGEFAYPYEITLSGDEVDHFTMVFDIANGQHPRNITIDDIPYGVSSPIFTTPSLKKNDTHTIQIWDWNTPLYPVTIAGIYSGITIDVTYRTMQQLSAQHLSRASNDAPSYGIISNVGVLQFSDMWGEVKDYADLQMLKADLKVSMFLEDTLSGKKIMIGNYVTDDWTYVTANREVTVQLKDTLVEWQSINHAGVDLERVNGVAVPNKDAEDMYKQLYDDTPQKYAVKGFDSIDKGTKARLSGSKIPKFYLESGTLWQQWTKLCELTEANIYQDFDGATVFKGK